MLSILRSSPVPTRTVRHIAVCIGVLLLLYCGRGGSMVVPAAAAAASMIVRPSSLKGQTVLVTGAGRGIGRAMARICHEQGMRVAIAARTEEELKETASVVYSNHDEVCRSKSSDGKKINGNDNNDMLIVPCDVTNETQVNSMVEALNRQWAGGIDVLINNAGTSQATKGSVESLSSSDLRALLELNVVAVHTVTSAVLRHKAPRSIINVSSRAGKLGIAQMSFYVASKFALEGYAATLAEELRATGTVVNTISPGMVNTQSFPKPDNKPGVRSAESIKDGLLLLLHEHKVTGHYLHVDELDQVRQQGLPDSAAFKPINESTFLMK